MQRIRIKKAPKLGDQVDYSFYDSRLRNTGMPGNTSSEDQVKNTMGPIPREEATIEVEKGEVVVGDTNEDGFLELFTFTGKPHTKGGTPVDVPPGSFIYSNTRKLRIKDPEVITKVFGLTDRKQGYTPAEIAKNYQINEHVATLKDDRADNIQKRSASEMLKNNLQKLGVLALVQESMKGFPDGIPAIAESAALGLGMDPSMFDPSKQQQQMNPNMQMMHEQMESPEQEQAEEQQMPMARYGGLPRYQQGTTVRKRGDQLSFTPDTVIYINGQPHRYSAESQINTLTPNQYVFENLNDGNKFYIDEHSFNKSFNTSVPYDRMYGDQSLHYYIGETNEPFVGDDWYKYNYGLDVNGKRLRQGDTFFMGNDFYKVDWPYAATNDPFGAISLGMGTGAGVDSRTPAVKAVRVEPIWKDGKVAGYNAINGEQPRLIAGNDLRQADTNRSFSVLPMEYYGAGQPQPQQTNSAGALQSSSNGAPVLYTPGQQTRAAQPAQQRTQSRPAQPAKPAGKPKTAADALNQLARGGYALPRYQPAGTVAAAGNAPLVSQGTGQTNAAPDASAERFIKEAVLDDGTTVYLYINPATKQVVSKDKDGKVVAQQAMTPEQEKKYTGQHSQYGSKQVQDVLSKNPDTRYTYTNFGTFGHQPRLGNTGIYLSSGNATSHANGDLSPQEWKDFQDRHGDWIDQNYKGGFAQFQKDLQTSPEKGNAAAEWFQKKVNEYTQKEFGVDYFAPQKSSDNPYSVDSKFGQVTYSVPRFFNMPKETPPPADPPKQDPPKPGMKQAYYCVEGEDGSRGVQVVEYPENGAPTAPAGKSVKQYSSRADADAGCVATPEEFKQEPKKSGPWWKQDIETFTNTMLDHVNKYNPMMQQLDLLTSEYNPLKKDAQVANIQQMQNQFMNLAANSNDGNVATAAALGASGDSFQNAANVMGQIENQNSQLATQNSSQNVGIENQERQINAGLRSKYVGEMATGNQNFDNAQRKINLNRLEALKAGDTNYQHKLLQEGVITPEVFIDPINFKPSFTGNGRRYDLPDLYQNPYMASGKNTGMQSAANFDRDLELYDKYYKELLPKYGKDQAEKLALQKMSQYNTMVKSNPYGAASVAGLGYSGGYTPEFATGGVITIEDLFYMLNHAKKR